MDATENDRLDRDPVEPARHGDLDVFAILARTHGDRLNDDRRGTRPRRG